MSLFLTQHTFRYDYTQRYRLPYAIRKKLEVEPILPIFKRRMYMCIHYWCDSNLRALYLQQLLLTTSRYTKVLVHKQCVYATKKSN